jgi:hypothetical protein
MQKTTPSIQTPGNDPRVRIQQAFCTHFTADEQNNTFMTDTQKCGPQKSLINISTMATKFSPGFKAAAYKACSKKIELLL